MIEPLVLRRATIEDAPAVAEVHVRTWRAAYRHVLPPERLDALSIEARAAQWEVYLGDSESETIVGERDGVPLGFVSYGACRDEDVDGRIVGEIMALYVSPHEWGRGTGRALCSRAFRELAGREFQAVTLWVLSENARARRFYERMGFLFDGGTKEAEILGSQVEESRYRRSLPSFD